MQEYLGKLALARDQSDADDKTFRIGLISAVDPRLMRAEIAFGDLSVSIISATDVLVLKDKNRLYQDLLTSASIMETADFKTVFRVSLILEKPGQAAVLEAMEMLKDNPGAASLAMVSLDTGLSVSLGRQQGAERGSRR